MANVEQRVFGLSACSGRLFIVRFGLFVGAGRARPLEIELETSHTSICDYTATLWADGCEYLRRVSYVSTVAVIRLANM